MNDETPDSQPNMYYSVDQLKLLLSKSSSSHKSVIHFNTRSFPKNKDDVMNFLSLSAHTFSVICLSETWLSPSDDKLFTVNGYDAEYDHRKSDRHGGSAILISKQLSYKRRSDIAFNVDKVESVWIEFDRASFPSNKNTIIASIYRSPSSSYTHFCAQLDIILNRLNCENKNLIIVGDINIDITDITNSSCAEYANCFVGHGLESLLQSPTRCMSPGPGTLIDHVLTNVISPQIAGVVNFDITDHYPIFLLVESHNQRNVKTLKRHFFDSRLFQHKISLIDWNFVLQEANVEVAFVDFSAKILETINSCSSVTVTYKRYSAPRNPWITNNLLRSIRKKDNLHKKVKLRPFNVALKNRFKKYSETLSKVLKAAKRDYYQNQIMKNGNNNRKNWEIIKEFLNLSKQGPTAKEIVDAGLRLTNPSDIANAFNKFFSKVTSFQPTDISQYGRCSQSFYLQPTSPEEVFRVLCGLKCTGPGLDLIPPSKIKLVARELSYVLATLINNIFSTGIFPSLLKQGKVVPVFKKGDRNALGNYRPITILPFFSKLIEKLFADRLMKYLEKFNLLTPRQFGFRPKFSTELALIEFTDQIKNLIDSGCWAAAIFIDFTKAFDTINHRILYAKLESLGICGPALTLLQSYLLDRTQVVQFADAVSQPITTNQGVPQGSILGPLLFLLYVNDLPNCLNTSDCILYADDTTIFAGDKDLNNLTTLLNKDLSSISAWCHKNALQMNATKTCFMIFHTHHKQMPLVPSLNLDNHIIYPSITATFLGVVLDSYLKFNKHTISLVKKIGFGLRVLIKSRHYFQQHVLQSLYYAFIHSHLTYCLPSWGNTYETHMSCLYHLQNQAVRMITFSPHLASALPLYQNLKILPLPYALKLKLGLFIYRIRNQDTVINYISASKLLNPNNTRFSEQNNMLLPKVRTNYGKQTALFSGIMFWNSLPTNIKFIHSAHSFHKSLKNHLWLTTCPSIKGP